MDTIARQPLWQDGLDFRHGTGHGVGAYLNVHEGPHGIGGRQAYSQVPFQEGMVVTNGNYYLLHIYINSPDPLSLSLSLRNFVVLTNYCQYFKLKRTWILSRW